MFITIVAFKLVRIVASWPTVRDLNKYLMFSDKFFKSENE